MPPQHRFRELSTAGHHLVLRHRVEPHSVLKLFWGKRSLYIYRQRQHLIRTYLVLFVFAQAIGDQLVWLPAKPLLRKPIDVS